MAFVFCGNLLGNRGPLFFRQERVGRDGQVFTMLKFRTMREPDGEPLNEWTSENDPRVTPFGRFLRRSHLDELPQMVNIMRGDLAVVGPAAGAAAVRGRAALEDPVLRHPAAGPSRVSPAGRR